MKSVLDPDDRREILGRIRALSPEAEARWGRMSVRQMVCHVSDIVRVSLGERRATAVGSPVSRTLIKHLMMRTPARIPKGVPTTRELDQEDAGTAPAGFGDDVRMLVALLERFAADAATGGREHPYFGRLTRTEWGRFHYKHTDHHLRQFGG